MLDIIKLLLPIIIEIIGNKKKNQTISSVVDAVQCWENPTTRRMTVRSVIDLALDEGVIEESQRVDVILAFAAFGDNPLTPLYIEALYKMAPSV